MLLLLLRLRQALFRDVTNLIAWIILLPFPWIDGNRPMLRYLNDSKREYLVRQSNKSFPNEVKRFSIHSFAFVLLHLSYCTGVFDTWGTTLNMISTSKREQNFQNQPK